MLLREGRAKIWRQNDLNIEQALAEYLGRLQAQDMQWLCRGLKTEAWLFVLPFTEKGKELRDQGCRDVLFLCCRVDTPYLPHSCECVFSIACALDFKKVGRITTLHNELHAWVVDLSSKAFTP